MPGHGCPDGGAGATPEDTVVAAARPFFGGPLWKTLKAVQANRAHEVDDEYWMVGTGYGAADRVLTDLERYLPKAG